MMDLMMWFNWCPLPNGWYAQAVKGKFVVRILMTTAVALLLVNITSEKFMIANVYEREALCLIAFEDIINSASYDGTGPHPTR